MGGAGNLAQPRQVGAPDVAGIDQAQRQHFVLTQVVQHLTPLIAAARHIYVQAGNWQACGQP